MAEDEEIVRRAAGDPTAASVAMQAASSEDARAYLREQTELARLQKANLVEQNAFELSHLRWRRFNDQMKGAMQIMIVAAGLLLVIGIGAAIWSAAHDDGLVIEAFQVPPDMVARGLTGQAVASQLLDKLSALQTATNSARPAQSYANNWGGDIKVEIPNTGVSIGEFKRTLADWLGHETHISGEVFRDATGVTVTARVGSDGGASFHGAEADLGALLQKAAESVYKRTQPYRYAVYLNYGFNGAEKETWADSIPIFRGLTADSGPLERSWAYIGLGNIARNDQHDIRAASEDFRRSLDANPRSVLAYLDLSQDESNLEHEEQALGDAQSTERLMQSSDPGVTGLLVAYYRTANLGTIAQLRGDFVEMARIGEAGKQLPAGLEDNRYFWIGAAEAASLAHDGHDARANMDGLHPGPSEAQLRADIACNQTVIASSLQNDRAVTALEPSCEAQQRKAYPGTDNDTVLPRDYLPFLALAKARLGDIAGGEAIIAATPLDCDLCVRVRGDIAALKHDWNGAAHWFALVSARTPHIPFADSEWGMMLLSKGDLEGAIAKFKSAHAKGPHFADPLEMWGEALIRQNRSDLARAKFAEAAKYAPQWGRLHLKWGEALLWSGDKAGAAKEFAVAAGRDLSAADRAELARVNHG
jgi:tetratricopeptide (TPR) repeat protein